MWTEIFFCAYLDAVLIAICELLNGCCGCKSVLLEETSICAQLPEFGSVDCCLGVRRAWKSCRNRAENLNLAGFSPFYTHI